MMSPGHASSARLRSRARKNTGFCTASAVPVRHMLQLHAAPEPARAETQESDAVAMLRVDIGLHLEDEAGDFGLLGGIDRRAASAGCGRGAGASSATPRNNSRTPKLLSALPKNTGVRWPSR